jgi:hypothetical protein
MESTVRPLPSLLEPARVIDQDGLAIEDVTPEPIVLLQIVGLLASEVDFAKVNGGHRLYDLLETKHDSFLLDVPRDPAV